MYKSLVIALFFLGSVIWAEEIRVGDEVFFGVIISQTSEEVIFLWKGQKYSFPRESVESIKSDSKDVDRSFAVVSASVQGGTLIRGYIVENKNDIIVIQTDLGLIKLSQSKILKLEGIRDPDFSPNPKYLISNRAKLNYLTISIGPGAFLSSNQSLQRNFGFLRIQFDPGILNFDRYGKFGLTLEGLSSQNKKGEGVQFDAYLAHLSYSYYFREGRQLQPFARLRAGGGVLLLKDTEESISPYVYSGSLTLGIRAMITDQFYFDTGYSVGSISGRTKGVAYQEVSLGTGIRL
ncbi:hypothetical protein DLM77_20985 [Leptospira yasudae]|uniref:DUF481 domain-containing protein n=1 Tax=Leptospira yasudae TaxID=2202201 RepID=A0ABX9LXC1_9LEPT|nr:hypothetical protein DLM77_20985 [Leptospira yasudae]